MERNRQDDPRRARLAEALRANLRRRKDQAKRRAAAPDAGREAPEPAVNPPQTAPKGGGEAP